jgi:hypothetical protein
VTTTQTSFILDIDDPKLRADLDEIMDLPVKITMAEKPTEEDMKLARRIAKLSVPDRAPSAETDGIVRAIAVGIAMGREEGRKGVRNELRKFLRDAPTGYA